jgi:hypothetical protein
MSNSESNDLPPTPNNNGECVTEYRNAVDVFVDAKKSETPIRPRPPNVPRMWLPPRPQPPQDPGDSNKK